MTKQTLSVGDLCTISIFTALIAILAQIRIPMPMGVPLTMQTFAISLAGLLLGCKKAGWATLLYILLGAFGLPVFAGFTGGFGIVVGPTGGFILSFPIMALLIGWGGDKGTRFWVTFGLVSGTLVNFLCGMLYYSVSTGSPLSRAFIDCVLVFLPTAVIKAVAAAMLSTQIKKRRVLAV